MMPSDLTNASAHFLSVVLWITVTTSERSTFFNALRMSQTKLGVFSTRRKPPSSSRRFSSCVSKIDFSGAFSAAFFSFSAAPAAVLVFGFGAATAGGLDFFATGLAGAATFFRLPISALAASTTDSSHGVPLGKYPFDSIQILNARPSLPSGITTKTLVFQLLLEPFPASRSNCDGGTFLPSG